ncbi:MAG TPA: RDD family protein, partial [Candidatus Hydrogenedentes bacterium]|nr:RDD family protein [Candidatus Hydrogenedentota bacterium]
LSVVAPVTGATTFTEPGGADYGALMSSMHMCAECRRPFSADQMVRYGDAWICARCKPLFFQRLKEGGALPMTMRYSGFWIRFGAVMIDGIVLQVANVILMGILGATLGAASEERALLSTGVIMTLSSLIGMLYETLLVGKYGATVGKMAVGVKVVRPDGSPLTYLRAFGRHWGKMVSGLTMGIGYLMAAFDGEKRALHDRICDTRVVCKR